MKRLSSILTLLFAITIYSFSQSLEPKISFAETVHDFGEIKESDGKVAYTFEFKNIGAQPLIVRDVKASCGCTTPTWSKEPVLPGASGFVKAVFDPHGRPGNFSKGITVFSNDASGRTILRIVGMVKQRDKTVEEKYPYTMGNLRLEFINVSMLTMNTNEQRTKEIKVFNNGDTPLSLSFKDVPDAVEVEAIPANLAPKSAGVLKVTYDAAQKNDYDYVRDWFYLKVPGADDYSNRIMVTAKIVEDFSNLSAADKANAPSAEFTTTTFDFGTIKEGQKVEFDFPVKNTGKSNLIIRKIKTTCGCTAALPAKMVLGPGEQTVIKAKFDSTGKAGNNYKPITVITNSPSKPSQVLAVKGIVEKK